MRPVIILDGSLQSALASVRSLAKRDVPLIVGAARSSAMSLHSRYAAKTFVYTSPMKDEAAFVEDVLQIAKTCVEKPLIFCSSDLTYLPLARARERLQEVALDVFPGSEQIEVAFDKSRTLALAQRLGISIPETHWIESKEQLESVVGELVYPCFLKPRHSYVRYQNRGVWGKACRVDSADQLMRQAQTVFSESGEWPLIQTKVEGEERGIFALFEQGKLRVSFAHRRLRSMDPSGGASVLRESVELDPVLAEPSWKLLEALHWHGPAMVEWKYDSATKKPYLMEINGRFWGSLPLAIAAGVDFPWLWYKLAQGEAVEQMEYQVGIRSRQLLADTFALGRRLFSRTPGKWQSIKSFFRFREPGLHYDVASWDDPKPALWEVIDGILKQF